MGKALANRTNLKGFLRGKHFEEDNELRTAPEAWLRYNNYIAARGEK